MANVFLSTVWKNAEVLLKEAEHIIFCGYSFPDADIHVKYLLKRIEVNRDSPLRITVCNNYSKKLKTEKTEEKQRYTRFLKTPVNYTDYSFEDFAKNPELVL